MLACAKSSNDKLNIGDYVHCQGKLNLPLIKTPFSQQDCGYWRTTVRAVFESKKKKPHKGMQEHTPLLRSDSSELPPLLIESQGKICHIHFARLPAYLLNLNSTLKNYPMPPDQQTAQIAQDKYKSYRVEERFFSATAPFSVWGLVDSVEGNLVTVTNAGTSKRPCFAFNGTSNQVYSKLAKRFSLHLINTVVAAMFIYLFEVFTRFGVFGLIVGLIVLIALQVLSSGKVFE